MSLPNTGILDNYNLRYNFGTAQLEMNIGLEDWIAIPLNSIDIGLPNGDIFVGSALGIATPVAVSGDAALANTGALTLATVNSDVGSYTSANVTVDAKGRITAAANGTAGITALTGDVTASGSGSVAATIAAGHITPAKISTVPTDDFSFPRDITVPGTLHGGNISASNEALLGWTQTAGLSPLQYQTSTWPSTIDITFFTNQGIEFVTSGSTQTIPTTGAFAAQAGLYTVHNDPTSTGDLVVNGYTLAPGIAMMFQWNAANTVWDPIAPPTGGGSPTGNDGDIVILNSNALSVNSNFNWTSGLLTGAIEIRTTAIRPTDGSTLLQIFPAEFVVQPATDSASLFVVQDVSSNTILRVNSLARNVTVGPNLADPSASLDVQSTTAGFLPPRMSTTDKNNISSPAEGLMVYDTTLHKLSVFTGTVWETITSA